MLQGRASRVHFHFMFLQSMCIRIDIYFLHTDAFFFFSGGNTCIKREDFCHNACSELSNTNKPASVESLGSAGMNFNMSFLLTHVLVLFCCWNAACGGALISPWDLKALSSVCGNVCISASVHQILSLY